MVKRKSTSDMVEFSLGPHPAREGWEVARITYDASNPAHLAQVEAAIKAMVEARTRLGLASCDQDKAPAPADA